MPDPVQRDRESLRPAPPLLAPSSPREAQDVYRHLFDIAPLPMCVRDCASMGYLAVNEAAVAAYGYTREEFFRMDTRELLAPEERERFDAYLSARDPGETESHAGRWRHRRKDGSLLVVDTWSRAIVFNDRPARLVVARDITAQLQAESDAQIGRERFQLIASATSDAVWDWDFAANTLWWSESFYKLFGYSPDELDDAFASWVEAIHPEDHERVVRSLESARDQARESWREEYRFRRKDGSYATVIDRGRTVRDAAGRAHRMVGGMTDITEQSRLQKQYLRAQRLESIGTLAGGIAHDLNNMLSPILLALELVRMQSASAGLARYLDTIETSARRSADLVRQVLTFARGVTGHRVPMHAEHVIREAARFATETFPRNIRVVVELAPDLWPIKADATQLNQVLLNLALNARDAMPAGGQLALTAANLEVDATTAAAHPPAHPGPHLVLSVSDEGTGIAPHHLERIFEPFFTTKEIGKGTGLGLPTVHAIVREHGGFITVQSEPGVGSTFHIHLPARPGMAPLHTTTLPSPHETPAETRNHGPPCRTILLIDDEAPLREIARLTLESHGYTVLVAGDGAEGVALFAQNRDRIALVITDMAMPVMDGAATISALRRLDPRVPIVAISGHDPAGRLNRGILAEISHFLAKPFTTGQFLAVVRSALPPPDGPAPERQSA